LKRTRGPSHGMSMTREGMHESSPSKIKVKDKYAIPSFLDGFQHLTEEDLDMLATFEEE